MFSADTTLDKRKVYYVGQDQEYKGHLGDNEDPTNIDQNLNEWIETQLKDRFINLYIYGGLPDENENLLSLAAVNGIIMAEKQSQTKDYTGGIGITDLQVDYGKTNGLGSRRFVVRLTVNDATALNDKPEYAKLSTMQGEFMLLYGWSDPKSVPGFSATSPPLLEPDPQDPNRDRMVIPTGNMDTAGYWAAARVHVVGYDFSFNEMGQLEIAATFMDLTSMYMSSTKISSIATKWRQLMGTADYDPSATKMGVTKQIGANDFTHLRVTNSAGEAVPLPEAINEEQESLKNKRSSNAPNAPLRKALSLADGALGETVSEALGSLASYLPYDKTGGATEMLKKWEARKRQEKEGFPNGIGVSTYEKIERPLRKSGNIPGDATSSDLETARAEANKEEVENDEEGNPAEVEMVSDYKVKVVYYYLGWVLEAMKLSLNDINRGRSLEGTKPFIPKFLYMDNEPDSNFSSAFQSSVPRIERKSSYEEEIQVAIERLKTYCLPPKPRLWEVSFQPNHYTNPKHFIGHIWPFPWPFQNKRDDNGWDFKRDKAVVCTGRPW